MAATATQPFDWSAVASAWESNREHESRSTEAVSTALLAALDINPGAAILEVAAGTGAFALALAAQVGPTGRLLITDAASGMVDIERRTLGAVPNAEIAKADACSLPAEDCSFDAVVCSMGLMFVPNPVEALTEWRRVLKPEGRIATAVWGGPAQNPWISSAGMAAMMHGVVQGGPPTGPGGIFSLAEPAALAQAAQDAGLNDVSVTEVDSIFRFATTEEHFAVVTSLAGPLAVALALASDEQRELVKATVASVDAGFTDEAGVTLPAKALLLRARR